MADELIHHKLSDIHKALGELGTMVATGGIRTDHIEQLLTTIQGDLKGLESFVRLGNGRPAMNHRLEEVERWVEAEKARQEDRGRWGDRLAVKVFDFGFKAALILLCGWIGFEKFLQ